MDLIKYDMTDIWAVAGDVVAPDTTKIRAGWGVEVVPRQWWNWFENRQDQNIAYLLQKGFPEWDATTEYIINKSYVQRNGIVYKATGTSTNSDPTALTSWVRVFADYSVASNALNSLTLANNQLPYFNGTSTATTTTLTPFARTILDDTDDSSVRSTISAQQASSNLSALSAVTPAVNGLPYFTSTTVMGITTLTTFGRSLIDDTDAPAARSTLGVDSSVDSASNLSSGLATRQPISATLTALAATTVTANKLPYYSGSGVAATTDFTSFSRTLLGSADSTAARSNLEVDSSTTVATNLSNGLATKQPLNALLTNYAALSPSANSFVYYTSPTTAAIASVTSQARTLLAAVDQASQQSILGLVPTATTTDATVGRLARVGDFGQNGGTSISLANSVSANTLTVEGKYAFGNGGTDLPTTGTAYYVEVSTHGSLVLQKADGMTAGAANKSYTRVFSAGNWTSWDAKASAGANTDITSLAGLSTPLSVSQGGTGSSTGYADMVGATSSVNGVRGLVPAPSASATTRYLSSLGTWSVPVVAAAWGSITGSLSSQTDLQAALDNRPVGTNRQIVRAFGRFNTGTTPTIQTNFGIASITRNGAGDYTVTTTNAWANAVMLTGMNQSVNVNQNMTVTQQSDTTFRVFMFANGAANDLGGFSVSILV